MVELKLNNLQGCQHSDDGRIIDISTKVAKITLLQHIKHW